ncbi:MAG: hypothetical protein GF330_09150 [Candidatus Eisenbacteria bacterium]|nr:hypothetical protein [Candidatus Eisenbacteria bacterium]
MMRDPSPSPAPESCGGPRPRIGVTMMLDRPERDTHLPRYGMNQVYFTAIRHAGGVPVPIAPGPPEEMELYVESRGGGGAGSAAAGQNADVESAPGGFLDGLCLTGGGDPDPTLFGQEPIPSGLDIDLERDRSELRLLELARLHNLPILGICRGMQVMNVSWGGDLIQDIATQKPDALKHDHFSPTPRDALTHEIRIQEGSLLHELLGASRMRVNSIHHQAVGRLAEGWVATAWSADGLIEAMEPARENQAVGPARENGALEPARENGAIERERDDDQPASAPFLLGVQFHPEDLLAQAPMRRIFAAFIEAARARCAGR